MERRVVFLAPEPPPPDGGYDPDALPSDWPAFGELYGQPVPLRGIENRLKQEDLIEVLVKLPRVGKFRVFRGDTVASTSIDADGVLHIK